VTLTITFASQRVTFDLDTTTGDYRDVRIQSVDGGATEKLPRDAVGPVLDAAIRERLLKALLNTNAPRR
jgi:hypothetical protein